MGIENTAVTLICQNNVCHCDWRMTITGCEEAEFLRNSYIVNAGWSAAIAIFELVLLAHRLFWMKQSILDHDRDLKSFMKIKPLEGLLIATSLCFALRSLSGVLLILDILPNNILRALFFDLAWQPGFIGTTIYFVGIINTLPRLSTYIDRSWFPSPKALDIYGGILIFGPPITNNLLAIATGYFEDIGNILLSKIFIYIHCGVWFLYSTALSIGLAYFGWNLTVVINHNIIEVTEVGSMRHIRLKKALSKLRIVFSCLTVCFLILGASMIAYIFQRDEILLVLDKSITTFIPWAYSTNILGSISFITIAAGSTLFGCGNSDKIRRGSHQDDHSSSKERSNFTTTDSSRHAASMERGRNLDPRSASTDRDRSMPNSFDRERDRSVSFEHDGVRRGSTKPEFEEKSFLSLSSKTKKPLKADEEADITRNWVIRFPDEPPRAGSVKDGSDMEGNGKGAGLRRL